MANAYTRRLASDLKKLSASLQDTSAAGSSSGSLVGYGYSEHSSGRYGSVYLIFYFGDEETKNEPYYGGEYLFEVRLTMPSSTKDSSSATHWPHAAPAVMSLTPNGKYTVNASLCISGLTFHHRNNYSPALNIEGMARGIESFFTSLDYEPMQGAIHHKKKEDLVQAMKENASKSKEYNASKKFKKHIQCWRAGCNPEEKDEGHAKESGETHAHAGCAVKRARVDDVETAGQAKTQRI